MLNTCNYIFAEIATCATSGGSWPASPCSAGSRGSAQQRSTENQGTYDCCCMSITPCTLDNPFNAGQIKAAKYCSIHENNVHNSPALQDISWRCETSWNLWNTQAVRPQAAAVQSLSTITILLESGGKCNGPSCGLEGKNEISRGGQTFPHLPTDTVATLASVLIEAITMHCCTAHAQKNAITVRTTAGSSASIENKNKTRVHEALLLSLHETPCDRDLS